jgi:hypothetical protein
MSRGLSGRILERDFFMKTILCASAVGLMLMTLPAISSASVTNHIQSGVGGTVLPQTGLSTSFFYRSYDCRAGSVPVTIKTTNLTPPTNGPTDGNTTCSNPPSPQDPTCPPVDNCQDPTNGPLSVPAPESSKMAGAGLAAIGGYAWLHRRKTARA